jgi:hypothetical protein
MPARLREIVAVLKQLGIVVEEPKKGSHFMVRREGVRPYPLSGHNGLKSEISDKYIRGLCAHFGLDVDTFKKLL